MYNASSGVYDFFFKNKLVYVKVELHTELERRLPAKLLEKVDKIKHREYPNKCGKYVRVSTLIEVRTYNQKSTIIYYSHESSIIVIY